jgi:hypothetical protein
MGAAGPAHDITTMTPKIVNGAIDLPDCASLDALIDWRAVQRLAA